MDSSNEWAGMGLAVRRARRARGLTLEQAAGLAGHTKSWLSKVENGVLPLDKRADIAALATALEVSADTLIGEPAPEVQPGRRSWNLAAIRATLLDTAPDDPPDVPARPFHVLRELTTQAVAACRGARYDDLMPVLPGLIGELEVTAATASGPAREEALRLLVTAEQAAVSVLRYLAQPDLAWVAGERGRQAAALLGDPVWEGAAAFAAAHARSSANRPRALMTMPAAADRLEPLVSQSRMAMEVYGMLRLSAALACAVDGDHAGAADHGAEAARIAAPLGDEPTAWEMFMPSNVAIWRTSLAVEAGNPERAREYAAGVEPRVLPSRNRRAAWHYEHARALAMAGKNPEAITELRRAERLSPVTVQNHPLLRELVRQMLDDSRRRAGMRDLRGLAWRMGMV